MKLRQQFFLRLVLPLFCFSPLFASGADSSALTKRQKLTVASLSTAYVGGFSGLYHLWYADYNTGHFHFFNDNNEWGQMDKVGHLYSAYAESKYATELFRWSGFNDKKSAWLGAGYSFMFQTTIEVFDGFSEGWGASVGDLAANFAGTGLYLVQDQTWGEQRFTLKYSYRETQYPQYRPGVLGSNFAERIIKDYNGQTYWLSTNISSFLGDESTFPKWLNIAVGYGVDGYLTGSNDPLDPDFPKIQDNFPKMRIFYLSPDFDLEKIDVKNKGLKVALSILNNFKFPLPAVGFSTSGKMEFLLFGF